MKAGLDDLGYSRAQYCGFWQPVDMAFLGFKLNVYIYIYSREQDTGQKDLKRTHGLHDIMYWKMIY